ncbi:serine-rich coiled-coil domain-containing protein 2 isoform X1 [Arapaima gigas]
MEEKAPSKHAMVSRLPKFGVRSESGPSSQPCGSGQIATSHEGKNTQPRRLNGMVRIPSFSLKHKKESSVPGDLHSPEAVTVLANSRTQGQQLKSTATRAGKKPSTPSTMVRKHTLMAPALNPKMNPAPSKSTSKMSSEQTPSLNLGGIKPGPCLGPGACSSSGLPKPRTGSSRSELQDSLSHSTDSLRSPCLEHMVRSQSFTHVKQLPSPTSLPMARSFSFNKAVELAKPLVDTQLRIQAPQVKSGFAFLGGKGPMSRAGTLTQALPLREMKKPLLAGCALDKPLALNCRLPKASHLHSSHTLPSGKKKFEVTVKNQGKNSEETPLVTSEPISDEQRTLVPKSQLESPTILSLSEGLEDMSLSSSSSLDQNDATEELLDDPDHLGDGRVTLVVHPREGELLPSQPNIGNNIVDSQQCGTAIQIHDFLLDNTKWAGVNLAGVTSLSIEEEVPCTSSLDLSPSNSSGGTYLWDEEGLEPLSMTANACRSCDSDINSMEMLNNLDNLGSCDLDDGDLMLDVDLPEDGSLHSDADRMSQFDRAEKGGRQGQWRRRQQHRWTGPDRFHNDNRGASFQPLDGHTGPGVSRIGHHPPKSGARPNCNLTGLDETTLRHMAQDCSSVKSQLIKLRNLLQMEDGVKIHKVLASELSSSEISEDPGSALQAEELKKEVQELREELRSKERTIAQLTQQVGTHTHTQRCQCQQRAMASRGERRLYHDKATQTPWRGQSPQILQSSNPVCRNKHLPQERLARIALTEDPSDAAIATKAGRLALSSAPSPPVSGPAPAVKPAAKPAAAVSPASDTDELSLLLCTHLKIDDPDVPVDTARVAAAPGKMLVLGVEPHPDGEGAEPAEKLPPAGRPRVLQPPRFHKRVSIPALPLQGATFSRPTTGDRIQLPPPSHGLPCFSSGALAPTTLKYPRVLGCSGGHCLEEAERNTPIGLLPSSHSRLPKPKIH